MTRRHPAGPAPELVGMIELVRAQGAREGHNLVAFSGGVDSTLVAWLVFQAFPQRSTAVIGVSAAMPMDQLQLARSLAQHIGIPLQELSTGEGNLDGYVANEGNSCYFCKSTLYSSMTAFSSALADSIRREQMGGELALYNGTNADDLTDPTRVGLIAAQEFRVVSPLRYLTKAHVRQLSRLAGLPNWDHAASPCLRSRLQLGVPATPDNLRRVELAEGLVRSTLELNPRDDLRVRLLKGHEARIELTGERLESALQQLPTLRPSLIELGFAQVSVEPFRSGSVSRPLDV